MSLIRKGGIVGTIIGIIIVAIFKLGGFTMIITSALICGAIGEAISWIVMKFKKEKIITSS